MAKLTLNSVANGGTAGIAQINANNDLIEVALENTLSRDGTSPNQMNADLDMNNHDILNVKSLSLPGGEDLVSLVDRAEGAAEFAETQADLAEEARILAEAAAATAGDGVATVETVAALKTIDTTAKQSALVREDGKSGLFKWVSSNLSSSMVVSTIANLSGNVNTSTDTISMRSATTTAVNSTTNVATAVGHGFVADEEVYITTTVNGLTVNGRYSIFFDSDTAAASGGNADNFKLRTSLTALAFDLTGTTNFTVKAKHNLLTGQAVYSDTSVNGLTANTRYYVIRVDANAFKLAASFADAHNGVAVDLTGTSAATFKHLLDPLEAIYVVKTSDPLDGSNGAWVRQEVDQHNSHWYGAIGDDDTSNGDQNSHALQASLWAGYFTRKPTYTPAGNYYSSFPLVHLTEDWVAEYSRREGADNGISWFGDGRELTIIKASSSFPDSSFMMKFDGNINAVATLVGSRPMSQGTNFLRGLAFHGRGKTTGTNVQAIYVRACWGMFWEDLDFRNFSGDFVTVFSGAGVGSGADEVDNTSRWKMRTVRMQDGGKSGLRATSVRITDFVMEDCEISLMETYGVVGAFVNSTFKKVNFITCGNRTDTTSCGLRLQDSLSGTLCRNVTIKECVFENNFNCEFSAIQCRGLTLIDNNVNLMQPTGGVVSDKSGFRLVGGAAGYIEHVTIIGGRFSDYQGPSDGVLYEVPYIDIKATVKDVLILNPHFVHSTTHVKITSGDHTTINSSRSTDVILSGTTPSNCFLNGKSLGTVSSGEWGYIEKTPYTPVVTGSSSAGTLTSGSTVGEYVRVGDVVHFTIVVVINNHTGTGDTLVSLPFAATESSACSLSFNNLTYTNTPFAEIIETESNVRLRQAASGGGVSGIPIDASCTFKVSGTYFVG